jgi:serine phosphatase RsbU (regulator of sigma subunit)
MWATGNTKEIIAGCKMEVNIAVSKTKKYATSRSGDTVEVVERPRGGVSVVMADGQSSGRGAKWISTMVVRKVISLLAEGVRDGAAARAASDSLFTERNGRVSSTLNILSVDVQTNSLVITRNNPAPVMLFQDNSIKVIDSESNSIGFYSGTRPNITEVPLEVGLVVVSFTDGLIHAGDRSGKTMDIKEVLVELLRKDLYSAQEIADLLMERAMILDEGRPVDDISIVVLQVQDSLQNPIRRMNVRLPIN